MRLCCDEGRLDYPSGQQRQEGEDNPERGGGVSVYGWDGIRPWIPSLQSFYFHHGLRKLFRPILVIILLFIFIFFSMVRVNRGGYFW
ncbi:hypothetical protein BDV28DRAFT_130708 [Aspergillus coremiiformis]|uniref:Uncharacterized protein n=1 Tax=Aspergillus coremiiformis TaxID=138285 RepID=A0A5N6ZCQ5_9EURO|nr:hypothetical protein BDV28DRAFT_130708 [Aspergillus coremiiformis]